MPRPLIDLTGQRFTRLVVLERYGYMNARLHWRCRCDCGAEAIVAGDSLRRSHTKSCGCLREEKILNSTSKRKRRSDRERFERYVRVDPISGCHVWVGAKNPQGYGQFRYRRRLQNAHRVAYQFYVGPIPEGLVVHHLCCRPSCVNVEHLEPRTPAENVREGRSTKLNMQAAETIRERWVEGWTLRELAEAYGITRATVSNIVTYKCWFDDAMGAQL